jgi:hypothetical protein
LIIVWTLCALTFSMRDVPSPYKGHAALFAGTWPQTRYTPHRTPDFGPSH